MFWQANEPDTNTKHSPELEPGCFNMWKNLLNLFPIYKTQSWEDLVCMTRRNHGGRPVFFAGVARLGICTKESEWVRVFWRRLFCIFMLGPNSRELVIYLLSP